MDLGDVEDYRNSLWPPVPYLLGLVVCYGRVIGYGWKTQSLGFKVKSIILWSKSSANSWHITRPEKLFSDHCFFWRQCIPLKRKMPLFWIMLYADNLFLYLNIPIPIDCDVIWPYQVHLVPKNGIVQVVTRNTPQRFLK